MRNTTIMMHGVKSIVIGDLDMNDGEYLSSEITITGEDGETFVIHCFYDDDPDDGWHKIKADQ